MKKVGLIVAMAALLASCSNDNMPIVPIVGNHELGVSAKIAGVVNTRSLFDAFSGTDAIGVLVSGTLYTPMVAQYAFSATAPWTSPSDVAKKIYLSNETATVYGFFPSTAALITPLQNDDSNKIKITLPAAEASFNGAGQTDYMYATARAGAAGSYTYPLATASNASDITRSVDLYFHHALSKVSFIINKGQYYTGNGTVTSLKLNSLSGFNTEDGTGNSTVALKDGTLAWTTAASATPEISFTGTATANAYVTSGAQSTTAIVSGLVAPRLDNTNAVLSANGITLKLTIDGKEMSVALPTGTALAPAAAASWVAGNSYSYTITIIGTELVVNSVTIVPWNNVDSGSANVQ